MTIVFADLSGFTRLAERSDPEDVRTMVDRSMCLLADVVNQFGGTVHQIAGDAMVVLFGAPLAHEDDPERAVRAALEMQRCAQENRADFGGLSLRIGVNTGEVMFAPVGPGRREKAVVGDVVNTAARLQTSAPQTGILVGHNTWQSTQRSIDYEPVEPLRVKNKTEPVAAWLATGCTPTPSERHLSAVPMVGRDDELQLLQTVWQRTQADARPELVAVCGTAGIGKSRLCHEFRLTVEKSDGRFLRGRSLPYGESTAYGAFAEMIKEVVDIRDTDSIEDGRAKLTARVAQLVTQPETDAIIAHLTAIAGLGSADVAADRHALFASAKRFIEALAAEKPTVFCFEDSHWAEPSLLDLAEFFAASVRNVRALFVVATRPELLEERELADDTRKLMLQPLPESAAAELSALVLGVSPHLLALVERLRVAAGGNPLFIEELAASLNQGAIEPGQEMPTSLKALIAARLDGLIAEQRQVLLEAAIIGDTFWRGALGVLHPHGGVDDALLLLEAQDLIRRQDESRLEGDVEYTFKHAVIREVAYGILSKSSRRKGHAAVATFLESTYSAPSAETSKLLAHHWRLSAEPWLAIDYLVVAAEYAASAWANREAVTLYNGALELMPEGDTRRHHVALRRAVAFQGWLHRSLDLGHRREPSST